MNGWTAATVITLTIVVGMVAWLTNEPWVALAFLLPAGIAWQAVFSR
ncbi:hypothetical protein HQ487_00340 [Candidatus Uhrbacteria bacterium]|nr:hypothetical protein [Candidatus Uhrbacteria bacterium]